MEVFKVGDRFRLTSGNEYDLVGAIVDYSREKGLKILSINTLKPTLEDAFLRITGSTPISDGEVKNNGGKM